MKKLYIVIICILVFISCKKEPKVITRLEYLNNLRSEVIYKGDTNSFQALFIDCFHDSDVWAGIELLPYAIIMSNKKDYALAPYSVFWSYSCIYQGNKIDSIDEASARMSIDYLEKSAKTGYEPAIDDLNKLPKNSNKMTYKEKFIYINSKR
ncbi:MAG: hypothetical protein H6Q15_211 [Bacteroidetes bacterium]|nr:hypothetical protein [Bacteroidota bacterium]